MVISAGRAIGVEALTGGSVPIVSTALALSTYIVSISTGIAAADAESDVKSARPPKSTFSFNIWIDPFLSY